jgi:hypothetical protein
MTGVAMRRKGLTAPGFLSELTTEHMQPGADVQGERDGSAENVDPLYGTGRKAKD